MLAIPAQSQKQKLLFLCAASVLPLLFGLPLFRSMGRLLQDERYSHVVVIPIIAVCLIIFERKRIFREPQYCPSIGIALLVAAALLYCAAEVWKSSLSTDNRLSLAVIAMVLAWIALFILCYGMQCFREAGFPLLFLLLMIPLPSALLDKITFGLQWASAEVTYALFKILGLPVFWQHFEFSLPGVKIEIAEECSGIRSAVALFITGLLAGHLFLHSGWGRIALSLATIPIAVFKNAVRIVTISSLGIYVDRSFFYGVLHHRGGVLFTLIALAIFVPLLFGLQKYENRPRRQTRELHSQESSTDRVVPKADAAAR